MPTLLQTAPMSESESSRPPLVFAYYVTGHGFGHATRVVEVVRHLISSGHRVHVVSAAPEFVFTTEIHSPNLFIRNVLLDIGSVQSDALTVDRRASLEKYCEIAVEPRDSILATEVEWLKSIKANLVVSDVVPIACRAAANAGIRSVCVTNFSWDFIYAEYVMAAGHHHQSIVWQIAEDYSHCEFLIRLPGHCPMPAFRDVIDIPLVVRPLHKSREEVRRELGVPDDVKLPMEPYRWNASIVCWVQSLVQHDNARGPMKGGIRMWKNYPSRYDHGVKREVKVNLVYPKYDHEVIQRIRKRHDDCSVFVNKDDGKGLNVVSISSVETFGGQGETFRAAKELYPHCVYQKASNCYKVEFSVGESQDHGLYGEEIVALSWGKQLGVSIQSRPHLEEECYIVISGRTQEAVRQAFTTVLLRWRCTLFEIPTLVDFKTIEVEEDYLGHDLFSLSLLSLTFCYLILTFCYVTKCFDSPITLEHISSLLLQILFQALPLSKALIIPDAWR